jgi:hypothetical protein
MKIINKNFFILMDSSFITIILKNLPFISKNFDKKCFNFPAKLISTLEKKEIIHSIAKIINRSTILKR